MQQDTTALVGTTLIGRELRDWMGEPVGQIIDLVFDDDSGEPLFLVVHPDGLWRDVTRDRRFVPAHRCFEDGSHIVTPFSRQVAVKAPKPRPAPVSEVAETAEAVDEHYHLWFFEYLSLIPGCDPLLVPDHVLPQPAPAAARATRTVRRVLPARPASTRPGRYPVWPEPIPLPGPQSLSARRVELRPAAASA